MTIRHASIVFLLAAGAICLTLPPQLAAGPPPREIIETFADPGRMFERFFGEETEEDKRALAQIEVSFEEEQRMGETAVKAYLADLGRQKIRVLSRGKEVEYLRDLVETVRPLMRQEKRYRTIRIYFAQSSLCEARSLPGGTLVFFRGLLEMADSEAAVLGIVGHELSHLDRGHHLLRLRRIKLAQQTFSGNVVGFSPQRFFTTGTTIARLWTRPFQPEAEAEADRDGATWAYTTGYDPRQMARLFLKLRDRDKNRRVPLPSFLQSHPPAEGRHKAIMKLYEQLQQANPKQKLYIGQENLRRRIARNRREFRR